MLLGQLAFRIDQRGARGRDFRFGLFFIQRREGADFDTFAVFAQELAGEFERCGLHFDVLARENQVVIGLLHLGQSVNDRLAKLLFRDAQVDAVNFDGRARGINPETSQQRLAQVEIGAPGIFVKPSGARETAIALGDIETQAIGQPAWRVPNN